MFDGHGVSSYSNGDRYEGEFKYGKKNGQGISIYSSGDKYIGEYKNNLRHGKGMFIWGPGRWKNFKWEGEFRNDKPWNVIVYKNNQIIENWKNGIKSEN